MREREKDVENQAKAGNTPTHTHTHNTSISQANYIGPSAFTDNHKGGHKPSPYDCDRE